MAFLMSIARVILHVDMDAFFAAVEQRDHPELRGKPVIVGAAPDQRGVVSTCSYEARAFGVRSAMPSREAFRRCPQGIFVRPNMALYSQVSGQIQEVFLRYSPLVEPVSIDEAFLDVTGCERLFGDGPTIATRIRADIRSELQLTASIGVAGNKFLAKLAGEVGKPDGLTVAPRDREGVIAFLAPLPVSRLWGVGQVTRDLLVQHGFRTIGDMQRAHETTLAAVIGHHAANHLLRLAFGEDERDLEMETEEKSISREHTFPVDCRDTGQMHAVLRDIADDVGTRLRKAERFATVGRLKLRWSDFRTLTRQRQFPTAVCDDFELRRLALELFEAEPLVAPVRLIGFGVSGLKTERVEQLSLFDNPVATRTRNESLCRAVDKLRNQFGSDHVVRADEISSKP
jgi:nucleotidyltransferase/DNA polymerase involved in DNA repair